MAAIQVVVVLYRRSFDQSESFTSLVAILKQEEDWAHQFSLLVYDNSPQPQDVAQTEIPVTYIHDPANTGLAVAYNTALARAEKEQCKWLLLLDQDTSLTRDFLSELLQVVGGPQEELPLGAIVPKLMVQGALHSPATNFITQLRRIRNPGGSTYGETVGLQREHLVAYNSGSTLSVSAMRAIGGFPSEFWLDFLDHAVFHRLFERGFRIYVMHARLTHDFSEADVRQVPVSRQLNVLHARTLYIKQNGSLTDQLIYRVWLLRHARSLRRSGATREVWRSTAIASLWLPTKHKH